MDPEKERKYDKKIQKIMKRSAIYAGVGLGFFILIPFLPDTSNVEKSTAMKELFSLTALFTVGYGILLTVICIFMRPKAGIFDGLMNFFVLPVFAIWFLIEAYKIVG